MSRSVRTAAAALLLCAPAAAFAHGGSFAPPQGGSAPQVPPGTADPPTPTTRWETWWAANKDYYLRLGEQMRDDVDGPTSGVSGPRKKPESKEEVRAARDAIVRESLVPLFLEALKDENFEVRTAAAIALGKTGAPEASKPLREAALKDVHKDVRDSAVLALGILGRPADIPFLDGLLRDVREQTRFRAFAAFSLGLIGGDDAAAALLTFAGTDADSRAVFEHEQSELVASTFVAMGLSDAERVLPCLRSALVNVRFDDSVHAFVMLSLGRLRDRESLGSAGAALVSAKDADLRRSAAIALGKIAHADDAAAVEALLRAVRGDPDLAVRQFAAVALGGIADARIRDELESLFDDSALPSRPFLALALALAHDADAAPKLRDALAKETDESTRSSYCVALALLGDGASAPVIERQLHEKGRIWLQGYAALALGMLRSIGSADELFRMLGEETDPRLRANLAVGLGLLQDPRAKDWLVKTLHAEGTVYERGGAAMAMGVLRMNKAVPDLVDVYRNHKEQELVRAFSVVALGLIADPSPFPKLARFAIDNNYGLRVDPLNEVLSIL